MKTNHLTVVAMLGVASLATSSLRALDVSDISIHGSASFTESSSDKYNFYGNTANGKFDSNVRELTVNGGYRWSSGLRLSAQVYASDVDDYNLVDLDFLTLDYQFKPYFGVRVGRNKSCLGLYGDSQDLDQIRIFANLPLGFYPRNARQLNYSDGAAFYGSVPAGKAGSFDYTVFTGRIETIPDDALIARASGGLTQVEQFTIPFAVGVNVVWNTPIDGLRFGVSGLYLPHIGDRSHLADKAFATVPGLTYNATPLLIDGAYGNGTWDYAFANTPANSSIALDEYIGSAEYTTGKWVFSAEVKAEPQHVTSNIPALGVKNSYSKTKEVDAYVQATYQVTKRIGIGAYYGYTNTNTYGVTPWFYRIQRDAAGVVSYAATSWWLFKVEFHQEDGQGLLENAGDYNPNALTKGPKWNYLVLKTTLSF